VQSALITVAKGYRYCAAIFEREMMNVERKVNHPIRIFVNRIKIFGKYENQRTQQNKLKLRNDFTKQRIISAITLATGYWLHDQGVGV
jgi:hypothetical protein